MSVAEKEALLCAIVYVRNLECGILLEHPEGRSQNELTNGTLPYVPVKRRRCALTNVKISSLTHSKIRLEDIA